MPYFGEILSLVVAVCFTAAALFCEAATKRVGVTVFNVYRMGVSLLFLAIVLLFLSGSPYPRYAGWDTWLWMLASGIIGFFLGDWCLFKGYLAIGARYGQLLFTLNPIFAVLSAWLLLGQRLAWTSFVAIAVTLSGIMICVLGKGEGKGISVQLPLKGVFYGVGAAIGQGLGYVVGIVGMNLYKADAPAAFSSDIPIAANFIRCAAGFACFLLWQMSVGDRRQLFAGFRDRSYLRVASAAVLAGPILGVVLSLEAARHCDASVASTLMSTTPIIILIPTYYLYKQAITAKMLLGSVVTVVGVSLFFLL